MASPMELRARRRLVLVTSAVGALVAAACAPERQTLRHLDHVAFLEAHRALRAGAGLHDAFIAGMQHIGVSIDQARAFRQPWVFLLWQALPEDALRWAFFVVVAFGAAVAASRVARRPEAGIAVGGWAAVAGVYGGVDAWMLYELWAVPLVLGTCWAWLSGRDRTAAALALGAVLLRETAVLLPLGFLVGAWALRRPLRPWLASLGAAALALALHWWLAASYLDPDGRSAALLGTGGLGAVAGMTSFLVWPVPVGVAVWAVGTVLLWRSALRPAVALAALPLTGLVVDRPYWGFLVVPLCITALGGLGPWPGRAPSPTPPPPLRRVATTAP